jgi:hypothetical protein
MIMRLFPMRGFHTWTAESRRGSGGDGIMVGILAKKESMG